MEELERKNKIIDIESIYPMEIEIKYDCLKIDNEYISSLIVMNFPNKIRFMKLILDLTVDIECEICFKIKKLNTSQEIKKITKIISDCKSEKSTINKNQKDIDIINNIEIKAIDLRKKVQVDNEELYSQAIYIKINDYNKQKLITKIKNIQDIMFSKGYILKPANFRQKEVYKMTLPLCMEDKSIYKRTSQVITTTMLAYDFMFFTDIINMKNGTAIGLFNNSLCVFDMFDKRNNNYNMCILGSSGSGKSYFTKLFILRNLYVGTKQIILDPEGEYVEMVKKIGGCIINQTTYNMLYINEAFAKSRNENILYEKAKKIIEYIETVGVIEIKTNLKEILLKQIIELYEENNIKSNLNNYYSFSSGNKTYVNKKYLDYEKFPNINNLVAKISSNKEINQKNKKEIIKMLNIGILKDAEKAREKISINISDSAKLICFNLKGAKSQNIPLYTYSYLLWIEEMLSEKTLIYIDEMWKCLEFENNFLLSNKIIEMFKTLRKNNAGIVAITQDIGDFFDDKNRNTGKIILNNCYTKLFFKMEYTDIKVFRELGINENNKIKEICGLKKGFALFNMGEASGILNIKASNLEHMLIEGVI